MGKGNNNTLGKVVDILLITGGINWGLVGLFGVNLVTSTIGLIPFGETLTYIAVGGAGVVKIVNMFMD